MNASGKWQQIEDAMRPIAQRSVMDARDVYRAFCNVTWVPLDSPVKDYDDILIELNMDGFEWKHEHYSSSWRSSGGFVADLRDQGENYLDFYCAGNEGRVTDEIREAMLNIGLRPVT